ncbi:MAG: twin-arginine translocase TatA/TatE family subunit [Deltaproteobacteria bacterium]|nr:twin-arginine translocase TatA/TatE family subunit [Deltaproteobacteria bacterium]
MFGVGTTELVLILVIILILFGREKLPEIGTGLGKALRNFKKATSEDIDITPAKENIGEEKGKEKKA